RRSTSWWTIKMNNRQERFLSCLRCIERDEVYDHNRSAHPPPQSVSGVDVDIMNKVGEKMGREVVFNNVEFKTIIDNVASGKLCDCGAAGITITEARLEKVDFSKPYFTSVQYVIFADGALSIADQDGEIDYVVWEQLAGKKIGVQQDTTGDIYVSDEIAANENDPDYDWTGVLNETGAEVVRFSNGQIAVDAMKANQVDVVVLDYLPASYIVSKNDGLECAALYYTGDEADYPTEEQYAIAVTKGNDELLNAINEVLDEMLVEDENGETAVSKLVMKHYGLE
ncbi:MAG: amino acid ABC transporter substrate-binding protein, partial [Oscillospiraceae bacterium]|nr:amino acid ABC transporter substrate-binding protein [Oscillospiraceae bacterium]